LTIADLRSETVRLRRRLPGGVHLIIVDYLQLISGRHEDRFVNRYEQVSEISRSPKMLAEELQIPVLAVVQLSREAERRPGKRPTSPTYATPARWRRTPTPSCSSTAPTATTRMPSRDSPR